MKQPPYSKYKKQLRTEAQAVLAEGKELWQAYFSHTDSRTVRDELKLNRADVGWHQIRKELEHRNSREDFAPVSFDTFKAAYSALIYMSIDSECQLFRMIPDVLHFKIKHSVYNRRKKKLFSAIEYIRTQLSDKFNDLEFYFIVDSMPLKVAKLSRSNRSII